MNMDGTLSVLYTEPSSLGGLANKSNRRYIEENAVMDTLVRDTQMYLF